MKSRSATLVLLTRRQVQGRRHFGTFRQFLGIMRDGNGVQIHDTKEIFRFNDIAIFIRRVTLILKVHPLPNGTKVIAQMQRPRGLHTRQDAAGQNFGLSGCWRRCFLSR